MGCGNYYLLTFNLKSYIVYDHKFELVKLLAKTVERFSIPANNCRLCLDALILMFDSKSRLTFGENKELRGQLVTYRNSLPVEKPSEQAESQKFRPISEKWWKINFLNFVWLFTVSQLLFTISEPLFTTPVKTVHYFCKDYTISNLEYEYTKCANNFGSVYKSSLFKFFNS